MYLAQSANCAKSPYLIRIWKCWIFEERGKPEYLEEKPPGYILVYDAIREFSPHVLDPHAHPAILLV